MPLVFGLLVLAHGWPKVYHRGYGVLFSRTKAKETLSKDVFEKEMSGITAKVGKSTLDESAGAYKDINMVMENQEELVDVEAHIVPIINIKA